MKIFILFVSLFVFNSYARWATPFEYDFVLLKSDSVLDVKKDGSYTLEVSKEFEILNQGGINLLSNYQQSYNPQTSKIILLEAWVINDGKKTTLPADVVSEVLPPGKTVFDELVQWSVAFNNLKVGSKLGLRYKLVVTKPLIEGHFSYSQYFGDDGVWLKEGSITVRSETALEVAKVDSQQLLKVEKSKKKQNEVTVRLVKPLAQKVLQEEGSYPPELISAVFFSTHKDWDYVRRQFQSRFELALNSSLPVELNALVEKARAQHSLEERLEILLNGLLKLTNIGDWRSRKGSYAPRVMGEVFKSGYADDKELASALVIMLRKLKYPASIALVEKSSPKYAAIRNLPLCNVDLFNHALVQLEVNGETYWIDPALPASFGPNISEELMGKFTLPLNESSQLVKLPWKNPEASGVSITNQYTLKDENLTLALGKISYSGTRAQWFREKLAANPKDRKFEKEVVSEILSHQQAQSFEFSPPKADFLKRLEFSAGLKVKDAVGKDEFSLFISVPPVVRSGPLMTDFSTWVLDLFLGEPTFFKREHIYKNVNLSKISSFRACEIKNQWVELKRTKTYMNKNLSVVDTLHIKVPVISNQELKSGEFQKFQKQLQFCTAGAKFYYQK